MIATSTIFTKRGIFLGNNSKSGRVRHVNEVKQELLSGTALPFKEVLSEEAIRESLERYHPTYRERVFSPVRTLWTFLSQVLEDDKSCQAAVLKLVGFLVQQGEKICSSNTSAYCKARSRLSVGLLRELAKGAGQQLQKQIPSEWLWKERHVKLVDGTTLDMPDTEANQSQYPQSKNCKKTLGYPLCRAVGVISLATGALLDFAFGSSEGKGTGEDSLIKQMRDPFEAGDIALGDGLYGHYALIAYFIQLGVDVVFSSHSSRPCDFRTGKKIGKKDHIIEWRRPVQKLRRMDSITFYNLPETIAVRELEITVYQDGFRPRKKTIATTLLDFKKYKRADIEFISRERWKVELDLRAIKQTMRMDTLRGRTPSMIEKEIWAHFLAYNLIRKIMSQAALCHHKKPRMLSFKLALQTIVIFRDQHLLSENNIISFSYLLTILASKNIGKRPGRFEPRKVKRRQEKYKKLKTPRQVYKSRITQKTTALC